MRAAITIVFVVFGSAAAGAQCVYDWRPTGPVAGLDGIVYAMTNWDPDGAGPAPEWLVLGGVFSVAGERLASGIVGWDGSSWHTFAGGLPNGAVLALTVYRGELIAGGGASFPEPLWIGGAFRWTGSEWERLIYTGNEPVRALTVHNDELVVGANYSLQRWNGTDWFGFESNPSGYIYSLASYGGQLYVGGWFNSVGMLSVLNIAKWNAGTWSAVAPLNWFVYALHVHNGQLYAGGAFSNAQNNLVVNCIARLDGSNWSALGSGMNGQVRSLASSGANLLVGGEFTTAGGTPAQGVALWSGFSWSGYTLGFSPAYAVAQFAGENYAAGDFRNEDTAAMFAARWTGSAWSPLVPGTGWLSNVGIWALAPFRGDLVAAGFVSRWDGTAARRIARWDGQTWHPLGSGVGATGLIEKMAEFQGDLYVCGPFESIGGINSRYIARWDGAAWQPVGPVSIGGGVSALLVVGDRLIVGGGFTSMGGVAATNIAAWDGANWSPLGTGVGGPAGTGVGSLTPYGDQIVAGGVFDSAGGNSARNVAVWSGSVWSPLGTGVSGHVRCLAEYNGEVIAGGWFGEAGGISASCLAAWNGTNWHTLGASGLESPYSPDTVPHDLRVIGDSLYVAGVFSSAGGVPASNIARWDGQEWHPLGSGLNRRALALSVHDGNLVVGGEFSIADGRVSAYWSRWGIGLAADLDHDRDVDLQDLAFLLAGYGATDVGPSSGDLDLDLDIDLDDLTLMLSQFGAVCD
jgi:hypothetical protein